MATNYDEIANDYKQTKSHPIKQHVETFTFLKVLGDVKAKSVLDLACGDGYYTRFIKQQEAARVIGVDISANMIDNAREMERETPLGIEYRVQDAAKLGQIGHFDRVTAVSLFPYAATNQTLRAMCKTMYDNLKPGGKLVSITLNPHISQRLAIYEKYGLKMAAQEGWQDGAPVITIIDTAGSYIELLTYYWSQATYERTLQEAGFQQVTWHRYQVSEEGLKAYGEEYWQAFLARPYTIILECNKS